MFLERAGANLKVFIRGRGICAGGRKEQGNLRGETPLMGKIVVREGSKAWVLKGREGVSRIRMGGGLGGRWPHPR